jgi:hypothetical protein
MIEFLIAAIPLFLLVALLVCGRYPGHRVAMRLAERISSSTRAAGATDDNRRPQLQDSQTIRGGLLIAFGLAQRPPPLVP